LYGAWDPKKPKRRRDSSASESSDSEKEECYLDAVGVDREDQQEDVDFSNCNDDNDDGSGQDPLLCASDQEKLASAKQVSSAKS